LNQERGKKGASVKKIVRCRRLQKKNTTQREGKTVKRGKKVLSVIRDQPPMRDCIATKTVVARGRAKKNKKLKIPPTTDEEKKKNKRILRTVCERPRGGTRKEHVE